MSLEGQTRPQPRRRVSITTVDYFILGAYTSSHEHVVRSATSLGILNTKNDRTTGIQVIVDAVHARLGDTLIYADACGITEKIVQCYWVCAFAGIAV
jgi:hypothetical protein